MKQDLLDMAEVVSDIVKAVPVHERAREIGMGADGTPTSFVDSVAEKAILDFVEERQMPVNILSEEVGYVERGFEDILVIDPVDGTYNCKRGIPYYSVSLAVGRRDLDGITHGVVRNIPTGDVFHAEKDRGAFLNNEAIRVKPVVSGDATIAAYFGELSDPMTGQVAHRFHKIRAFGAASLEICGVAEGLTDVYYANVTRENRSLRVTDIAAAVLVLREAGGEVFHLDGCPLEMGLDLGDRSNLAAVSDSNILELIM